MVVDHPGISRELPNKCTTRWSPALVGEVCGGLRAACIPYAGTVHFLGVHYITYELRTLLLSSD